MCILFTTITLRQLNKLNLEFIWATASQPLNRFSSNVQYIFLMIFRYVSTLTFPRLCDLFVIIQLEILIKKLYSFSTTLQWMVKANL